MGGERCDNRIGCHRLGYVQPPGEAAPCRLRQRRVAVDAGHEQCQLDVGRHRERVEQVGQVAPVPE